jgi:cytochrome P450
MEHMGLINIIKTFLAYRNNPPQFIKSKVNELGGVAIFKVVGKNIVVLTHPEAIAHVLVTNTSNYLKGRTTQKLKKLLGNGLITAEGEHWKKQNRLVRQSFTISKVKALLPTLESEIHHCLKKMEGKSVVNIHEEIQELSLNFIGRALFSKTLEHQGNFSEDIKFLMEYILLITRSVVPIHAIFPTAKKRKFQKIVKEMDAQIFKLIEERIKDIQNGIEHSDLLSLLINQENSSEMNSLQIRDEIMTLLMAGHETITNTLSWTMILLCQHSKYQSELKILADEIIFENSYDAEKLGLFNLADQVVAESMRIYPPVWAFMRENINEDQIMGSQIEKGSIIVLAPYITHNSEKYWDDPREFKPERFQKSTDLFGREHGLRYFPFGYGPRICLGAGLAISEAKLILLMLIKKYKFEIVLPEEQKIDAGITYRPLNNIQLKITAQS